MGLGAETLARANSALNFARRQQLFDYSRLESVEAPTPTRARRVGKQVRRSWLRRQAGKPEVNELLTSERRPCVSWLQQSSPTLLQPIALASLLPQTNADLDLDQAADLCGQLDWCLGT